MARLRVGVLISGRGSNLQALIEACADPAYPAEIVLVISNRPEAPGLGVAAAAGIPSAVIPHRDRRAFAAEAETQLREQRVELVCLAGFMRVLETSFVEAWRDRMVNIHPSLLPSFRGLHAQRQALDSGRALCRLHGSFCPPGARLRADHRPGGRAGPSRRRRSAAVCAHSRSRASALPARASADRGKPGAGRRRDRRDRRLAGARDRRRSIRPGWRRPSRLPRPAVRLYLRHGFQRMRKGWR